MPRKHAVKIDISPNVLADRTDNPVKVLPMVFKAARLFQPAVIFLKNIERLFYKTVPAHEKHLKAANLTKPLTKLLSTCSDLDKVIFIATCSDPFSTKPKPMMNLFNEALYVPAPDYGTVQKFFYDSLVKIHLIPKDINVQPLGQMLKGIGFGILVEALREVMTTDRIIKLIERPLDLSEFFDYLSEHHEESLLEPEGEWEYENWMNFCLQFSPIGKERKDYLNINITRANFYKWAKDTKQF